MQIININKNAYEKFIDYISQKCNKISFNYHFYANLTRYNILISNVEKKMDLKKINSQKDVINISNNFKNDFEIFDREYFNNEEKIKKENLFTLRKLYFCHLFDDYEDIENRVPLANQIINIAKKRNLISKFSNSKEEIIKLFEEFKNDSIIFDIEYKKQNENNDNFVQNEKQRQEILEACLNDYLYYSSTQKWINNYKNYLVLTKRNNNCKYYSVCYIFNLSSSIIKNLKLNTIFEWQYPETLEDISFFKKDGQRWMWSISHEDVYEICFQETDKEEYEYLKSIGIEFVEKEFIPTPKNYLHYLDEYITNN